MRIFTNDEQAEMREIHELLSFDSRACKSSESLHFDMLGSVRRKIVNVLGTEDLYT